MRNGTRRTPERPSGPTIEEVIEATVRSTLEKLLDINGSAEDIIDIDVPKSTAISSSQGGFLNIFGKKK